VSGHKAFTVILNNRAIAVDAAAASKSPVATAFCYRIYGGELFRPVRCGQRSAFICVHLRLRHKSRKISSRHVAVPSENCRP
jgi:hypothetical protein